MKSERIYSPFEIFICLGALMIFAALLSFFLFSHQSLRLDEAQSLWQTGHSPGKILNLIAQDVHVPLYHLILHLWRFFVGNTVEMARALSLIFFLASIPALYFLGKITHNQRVGLFAAFLLTISAFMNWYGNEIRMYSLFTFLTILNQYFFIAIFKEQNNNDNHWIWYTLTAMAGIYTHYFFWLLILAQAIFFFTSRKIFPENALRRFIGIVILLLILISPWIAYVQILHTVSNQSPQLLPPTTINIFNTFSQFLFGFQDDHLNTILLSLWPIAVLLAFLALRKSNRTTPETIYLVFALVVPIVVSFVISSVFQPVYVNRYLIFTLPALYLLLSWVFSTYPARLSNILTVVLVAAMVGSLSVEALSATTPVKENYREASMYLTEHALPQDIIVISAPFTIYPVEYYYQGEAAIQTLPIWNRFVTGPIPGFDENNLPKEVDTLKGDHYNLWLLLSYDQGYEKTIKDYFDTHYERIDTETFSVGLNLYKYKLRYDTPAETTP